jgi:hypothetical protein
MFDFHIFMMLLRPFLGNHSMKVFDKMMRNNFADYKIYFSFIHFAEGLPFELFRLPQHRLYDKVEWLGGLILAPHNKSQLACT